MRRRHPSPLELGAFFDGEPIDGVSDHIARCRKCRESLEELVGVRSAVRGELDLTDGSARRRARWSVALIPVAAAVALLVAVSAPPGGLPVTRVQNSDEAAIAPASSPVFTPPQMAEVTSTSASPATAGDARSGAAVAGRPGGRSGSAVSVGVGGTPAEGSSEAGASPESGTRVPVGAPAGKNSAGRSSSSAASGPAGGRAAAPPAGPLRLGVPVPTRGVGSGEGDEVLRAVRAVVNRTNDAGGAGGRRVEVIAVPTDDDAARSNALTQVDALVGGFAIDAPAGLPWIMPADVGLAGPDVAAAELAAEQAGAALGSDLIARGGRGTVAAVVAPGADGGLAAGLARSLLVHSVEAGTNTSCDQEIVALRKRDVTALALAGTQIRDLIRQTPFPAGFEEQIRAAYAQLAGVYAHLERDLVTQGARSAVALSTPNADDPGSSRFRQSAPGCESYRSLVSFAAAELAVGAAGASNGLLSLNTVRDRRWHSDLYDVDGGRHTTTHVVAIRFGRWTNSDARNSSPGMRRGVIFPEPGTLVALGPEDN